MRAIANSFAEKSMKQISVSPVACLRQEGAFSHSVRRVWPFFFLISQLRIRTRRKKMIRWSGEEGLSEELIKDPKLGSA